MYTPSTSSLAPSENPEILEKKVPSLFLVFSISTTLRPRMCSLSLWHEKVRQMLLRMATLVYYFGTFKPTSLKARVSTYAELISRHIPESKCYDTWGCMTSPYQPVGPGNFCTPQNPFLTAEAPCPACVHIRPRR